MWFPGNSVLIQHVYAIDKVSFMIELYIQMQLINKIKTITSKTAYEKDLLLKNVFVFGGFMFSKYIDIFFNK
jgi:hypothetical protein